MRAFWWRVARGERFGRPAAPDGRPGQVLPREAPPSLISAPVRPLVRFFRVGPRLVPGTTVHLGATSEPVRFPGKQRHGKVTPHGLCFPGKRRAGCGEAVIQQPARSRARNISGSMRRNVTPERPPDKSGHPTGCHRAGWGY